jgi:hypothetical protein
LTHNQTSIATNINDLTHNQTSIATNINDLTHNQTSIATNINDLTHNQTSIDPTAMIFSQSDRIAPNSNAFWSDLPRFADYCH